MSGDAPISPQVMTLPEEVRDYLLRHDLAQRRVGFWRAATIATVTGLVWLILCCFVDRAAQLSVAWRSAALLLALTGMLARVYRPIRSLLGAQSDLLKAAGEIELLRPGLNGRLTTVCSRLPEAGETSRELLAALAEQVRNEILQLPPPHLACKRELRGPLIALTSVLVLIVLLSLVTSLRMPRLLARCAAPWMDVAPATTVQLRLAAPVGSEVNVRQGRSVLVIVEAKQTGRKPPLLERSSDRQTWIATPMEPAGGGIFSAVLPPVVQEEFLRVACGDAVTLPVPVRVLRKPGIISFRARYEPGGAMVQNRDGLIEATAGTTAMLSITATEPLESATLHVNGKDLPMQETGEPMVYQASFEILRDQRYRIDLASSRGLVGASPDSCAIRVLSQRTASTSPSPATLPGADEGDLTAPIRYEEAGNYRPMLQAYFGMLRKAATQPVIP